MHVLESTEPHNQKKSLPSTPAKPSALFERIITQTPPIARSHKASTSNYPPAREIRNLPTSQRYAPFRPRSPSLVQPMATTPKLVWIEIGTLPSAPTSTNYEVMTRLHSLIIELREQGDLSGMALEMDAPNLSFERMALFIPEDQASFVRRRIEGTQMAILRPFRTRIMSQPPLTPLVILRHERLRDFINWSSPPTQPLPRNRFDQETRVPLVANVTREGIPNLKEQLQPTLLQRLDNQRSQSASLTQPVKQSKALRNRLNEAKEERKQIFARIAGKLNEANLQGNAEAATSCIILFRQNRAVSQQRILELGGTQDDANGGVPPSLRLYT